MANKTRRRPVHGTPPRPGKAKDRGPGVRLVIDGETREVFNSDLTSLDAMALRRATGLSFMGVLRAFGTDPDIDLIAAIYWLSRRVAGEPGLSYEEAAADITYDTSFELVKEDDDQDDADTVAADDDVEGGDGPEA